MAPSAVHPDVLDGAELKKALPERQYLRTKGALDGFKYDDLTPVIGREYPETNIVDDIINAPDADDKIRDLAITISERGVVYFRAQDNLTDNLQKTLIQKLGELTGKPSDSTLHIHPVLNDQREFGPDDPQISAISSVASKTIMFNAAIWHTDISFEPVPADYTSLRLTQLPKTGGDTLWASGYELFDRISEPYQKFLEGLTATHSGAGFNEMAKKGLAVLYDKPRGSPENSGLGLTAVHPVIRTNPVTGWKSLYAVGPFNRGINGLTKQESDRLKTWFHDSIIFNHDLQVRFKWKSPNDIAIWDNRSVYHTATNDYDGLGERSGNRAVGIGERPFYDPNSTSRRQALEERENEA